MIVCMPSFRITAIKFAFINSISQAARCMVTGLDVLLGIVPRGEEWTKQCAYCCRVAFQGQTQRVSKWIYTFWRSPCCGEAWSMVNRWTVTVGWGRSFLGVIRERLSYKMVRIHTRTMMGKKTWKPSRENIRVKEGVWQLRCDLVWWIVQVV